MKEYNVFGHTEVTVCVKVTIPDNVEVDEQKLFENKISFNQLIKCFNFWDDLSQSERHKAVDDGYINHKYDDIGWY